MASGSGQQLKNRARSCGGTIIRYAICMLCLLSCGVLYIMSGIPFKPRTRIKVAWISVIILAIFIGFPIIFITFGVRKINLSPTDMKVVTMKSYPYFCSSFDLDNSDYPVDVYKFNDKPTISDNVTTFNFNKSASLAFEKRQQWKYYLLQGSFITVHVNDLSVDVYIVKQSKLTLWKIFRSWFDFHELHSDARVRMEEPIIYQIQNSDEYYLIVYNGVYSADIHVEVDIELNRTMYDFLRGSLLCSHSKNCSVPFPKTITNERVVIYSPAFDTDNVTIETKCEKRHNNFIFVFGLVPVCIAIIWSALICLLCIRRRRRISEWDILL